MHKIEITLQGTAPGDQANPDLYVMVAPTNVSSYQPQGDQNAVSFLSTDIRTVPGNVADAGGLYIPVYTNSGILVFLKPLR